MKPRSKFLALAAAFVIGLVGYATVHKNLPYFADVPAARFRAWHPAPYLPAGEGPSWKLSQYLEDGGALNADVDHFVLQRDGKAYDLINSRDTWGFADAISWKIVLIGDKLYIFDAHQTWEQGWFHIVTLKYDWLLPKLGMAPDGTIHKIERPTGIAMPSDIPTGSVFKIENGHLQYIGVLPDYDDLFEHLKTGDYYLTPPGTGVRKIIDLKQTPSEK